MVGWDEVGLAGAVVFAREMIKMSGLSASPPVSKTIPFEVSLAGSNESPLQDTAKEETNLMSQKVDNEAKARQRRVQETFEKIYYGETSNLECPFCQSSPLRFSYSFVEPDRYRIWISCTFCGNEAHLRLAGRPPGYDERYVLKEFQERDEQALKLVDERWMNL